MLTIHDLSYQHPDKALLFHGINFVVNSNTKVALIGNNGTGKSTLLKIIADILEPSEGTVKCDARPYYVPQLFGQYNQLTIAEALSIDKKLKALHDILAGKIAEESYDYLQDDWTIEERCQDALDAWGLRGLQLSQKMDSLSGGQKTKVFLAGISIHQPQLILMDEPSNHLDHAARQQLYHFIQQTKQTLLIVSHDMTLLNLLDITCELSKNSITTYGGNYDFYSEQKQLLANALAKDIHSKEKMLRKAKEKERETIERQQKLDSRGKRKQEKSAWPEL